MKARKVRTTWITRLAAVALATGALASPLAGCQKDDVPGEPLGTQPGGEAGTDSGLGLDNAPAGTVLAKITFARPVALTVPAGEHVIITFEDKDFAVIDMSDPTKPGEPVVLTTNSKIVAVEYDEERQFAYAVDVNGTLWTANILSAAGAELLAATATSPALAGNATAISRVSDRLFVLAGTNVVPFLMTLVEGVPTSVTAEAPVAIGGTAVAIAAGAGHLYLAMNSGEVQSWLASSATPSRVGSIAFSGELKALLAKGSKVVALSRGTGMNVVDFGAPSSPVILKTEVGLSDVTNARLFGRTLLVGLERGQVSTLDLSNFAAPVPVTTNKGAVPTFMVVVNGNAVWGSGKDAQVVGIPPVVTAVVPTLIKSDFPLNGQIPVTFSKPIDPAMATAVKVLCKGTAVDGTTVVSIDRLTASFRPAANLPPATLCAIDVSGVKDTQGLPMSQGSQSTSFTFTTSKAAPAVVENPGSKYAHTADGRFTDFGGGGDAGAPAGQFEWFDVKPAKGMYTYFYADFDGENLWLMNDWFYNGDNIEPDCYNLFNAWTGGGSERWEIRAYGNQRVEVRKNNVLIDPTASGVQGGAGYVKSPNVADPHTIYELKIPAKPGTWGVQLHDPGPTFNCNKRMGDPTGISGALAGGTQSSSTIGVGGGLKAPIAPVLVSPEEGAIGQSLQPTLQWRSDNLVESFVGYQLQVASNNVFTQGVWNGATNSTSYALPRSLLVGGTTYFWRVTAWNSAGRALSDTRQFTTIPTVKPGEQLLTVAKVGQGTVTSQPAGINCGSTCQAAYLKNTDVVLSAVPAQGWAFTNWTGDCKAIEQGHDAGAGTNQASVIMDVDRTCVANFKMDAPVQYTLTTTIVGSGTVTSPGTSCSSGTCSQNAVANSTIVLTASPTQGNTFSGWSGACQGTNNVTSVAMDGNKACTATFAKALTATLTVAVAPANSGTVNATSPAGQIDNCGSGANSCTGTYATNTNVTIVAAAVVGYRFSFWSGSCTGTNPSFTIAMDSSHTCTANFVRTWPFVANKNGMGSGTVVMSGTGGGTLTCGTSCSTNTANYDDGTNVTLTATAAFGSAFLGWSNCSVSTNASISVAANMATTCTARFEFASLVNLAVQMTGQGTVTGSSGGFTVACTNGTGTCTADLPLNTQITLTASPNVAQGYTFVNWTNCASTTSASISITMNAAKTCVATFTNNQPLSVTVNGQGNVTGTGINCGTGGALCSSTYALNTTVDLTAAPVAGNTFTGWSNCSNSTNATITVTMSAARTCVATFATAGFTMTVTPFGTGTGTQTVTSADGNLSCTRTGQTNSGTCTFPYATNATVNLLATPAADSAFLGWTCNSTGLGTSLSLARTMDRNWVCTANFDQRYTLTVAPSPSSSGVVVSQDFSIICGATCTKANIIPSTTLQITAAPNSGKTFLNWSGTLPGCSGTNATTTVTVNATSTCTANFSP